MDYQQLQQIFALIKGGSSTRFRSYRGNKHLWAKCPFPHPNKTGEDTRPSLMIKPCENNNFIYYCTSCKNKGNAFTMIKELAPSKMKDLRMIIHKDASIISVNEIDFEIKDVKKTEVAMHTKAKLKYMQLSNNISPAVFYFGNKNITEKTLKLARCKYSDTEKRAYFPVYDIKEHVMVGLSSRSIDDNFDSLRWKHIYGFDKTNHFFFIEDHRNLDYIILVEGISDVLRLYELGYIAFAILGASISIKQSIQIINIGKPVKIFLDGDNAGIEGAKQCENKLYVLNTQTINCKKGKDPGDLTDEEIIGLLGEKNGQSNYK